MAAGRDDGTITGADGGSVTDVDGPFAGAGASGLPVGSELDPMEASPPPGSGTWTGRDSGTVGFAVGSVGAPPGRLWRRFGEAGDVEERPDRSGEEDPLGSLDVAPASGPPSEADAEPRGLWSFDALSASVAPLPPRAARESLLADAPEPEASELLPEAPPDPVVSATATGRVTAALPMPSATARAPTRPMKAAWPPPAGPGGRRRGPSIDRNRNARVSRSGDELSFPTVNFTPMPDGEGRSTPRRGLVKHEQQLRKSFCVINVFEWA